MKILLQWYGRRPDFNEDPEKKHELVVVGDTAADCMGKINSMRSTHDLARFTPIEIVSVID